MCKIHWSEEPANTVEQLPDLDKWFSSMQTTILKISTWLLKFKMIQAKFKNMWNLFTNIQYFRKGTSVSSVRMDGTNIMT